MENYKLKDICQVVNGRAYKQTELLQKGKYKVLRVGNFFTSDRWYYSDMELDENKYCDNDDLLYAWSASFGPRLWEGDKTIYHYHIWKMIPDPLIVNKYYLYYWLLNNSNQLTAGTHGSVMAHITKNSMENQSIELPNLDIQIKVSDILHTIDEKIKTNEKINRNLLDQAIAIFADKIWLQDKNGTIGDYCTMKSGFAFKSSWWTDNGIKVIKIGDINQDNLNLNSCSCVDEDKFEKAGDFAVVAGDLVLAMTGATIGKFAMIPERKETILVNQRVGKFFLGNEPLKRVPFIYCTLKMDEVYSEVIGRGQGSAQPNISAGDVMTIPCVIPSQDEIDEFNAIAGPMFTSIVKNQNENEQLANLRDSLLPKLMSGELDVTDLDI